MTLPRYERRLEEEHAASHCERTPFVSLEEADEALNESTLSPGSRRLLKGLLRTGTTRVFPGGGIGIEYGSLLKTAARPDDVGEHVQEVAEHLREKRVDLLFVPGMSGYPIGAMYAYAAGIPAILLKKQKPLPDGAYPTGSFIIPSYTGDGDVVMSADLDAVQDVINQIVESQVDAQRDAADVTITIRCAGADDIIDKAVMAHAITECAPLICQPGLDMAAARRHGRLGDARPLTCTASVVAWVTPLMKSYNDPAERLRRSFGIEPFAGISIIGVHLHPPAISVAGAGTFLFRSNYSVVNKE